jgi:hypothetical protein
MNPPLPEQNALDSPCRRGSRSGRYSDLRSGRLRSPSQFGPPPAEPVQPIAEENPIDIGERQEETHDAEDGTVDEQEEEELGEAVQANPLPTNRCRLAGHGL